MSAGVVPTREVVDLLCDLRRIAEMPAGDWVRQAWMVRKQDVLDRIEGHH